MALIRWEPVAELNTIQNEMNRLFNTFFDQPARPAAPTAPHTTLDAADGPGRERRSLRAARRSPRPLRRGRQHPARGQRAHDLRRAQGRARGQQEGYYRLERAFGSFSRSLTLPDGVDPDGIQAHFDRGVLEITIPKPEQKKPRTGPDHPRHPPHRRHQDHRQQQHGRPTAQRPRPSPSARLKPPDCDQGGLQRNVCGPRAGTPRSASMMHAVCLGRIGWFAVAWLGSRAMSTSEQIRESIDARLGELRSEMTLLQSARAALRPNGEPAPRAASAPPAKAAARSRKPRPAADGQPAARHKRVEVLLAGKLRRCCATPRTG